jgi:chromosome segregation ATPase
VADPDLESEVRSLRASREALDAELEKRGREEASRNGATQQALERTVEALRSRLEHTRRQIADRWEEIAELEGRLQTLRERSAAHRARRLGS